MSEEHHLILDGEETLDGVQGCQKILVLIEQGAVADQQIVGDANRSLGEIPDKAQIILSHRTSEVQRAASRAVGLKLHAIIDPGDDLVVIPTDGLKWPFQTAQLLDDLIGRGTVAHQISREPEPLRTPVARASSNTVTRASQLPCISAMIK